jgi:hypothetical protein
MSSNGGWVSSALAEVLNGTSARGTMHSIFQNSFNVAFDAGLLNVQASGGQLAAFGITLDPGIVHSLIAQSQAGDMVRADGQRLRFYPTYGEALAVDLVDMPVKDLRVPPGIMTAGDNDTLGQAIRELRLENRLGIAIDEAFSHHTAALAATVPDAGRIRDACAYLVGRGSGLTPSGDDIVTGYAFWLMARGGIEVDPGVIDIMQGRTTDISVSFITMLARGYTSEYYKDLCAALIQRSSENLARILGYITRIGHSSGRDSLFGIWLATQRMAECAAGASAGHS